MITTFFASPILNSPYLPPNRHWELDGNGQPTETVVARRRTSALVSPIPKARWRGGSMSVCWLTRLEAGLGRSAVWPNCGEPALTRD